MHCISINFGRGALQQVGISVYLAGIKIPHKRSVYSSTNTPLVKSQCFFHCLASDAAADAKAAAASLVRQCKNH